MQPSQTSVNVRNSMPPVTPSSTPTNGEVGLQSGEAGSACSCPPSKNSGGPVNDSNGPWRLPRTVRELAAQANEVATQVLAGTIDFEKARTYSALTRTVAQFVSAEVARSRLLKTEPNLSFEEQT